MSATTFTVVAPGSILGESVHVRFERDDPPARPYVVDHGDPIPFVPLPAGWPALRFEKRWVLPRGPRSPKCRARKRGVKRWL